MQLSWKQMDNIQVVGTPDILMLGIFGLKTE